MQRPKNCGVILVLLSSSLALIKGYVAFLYSKLAQSVKNNLDVFHNCAVSHCALLLLKNKNIILIILAKILISSEIAAL